MGAMALDRILGYRVIVKKTEGEYTVSGPQALELHADLCERGFRPEAFQCDGNLFTLQEDNLKGSFEANRIRTKLNHMANELQI
jgi:hypothetical protein